VNEFHPVLSRLSAELEGRQLRWMLLRTPSVPAAPTGDVDLLVAPADAVALRDVATSLGFVALPGWESPPGLLLVSYHRESDRWLVLDVTTSVSFTSARFSLDPEATMALLQRRRVQDGMTVPADEDAFWLLLLHCLLDKGRVAEPYRGRLRALAQTAMKSALATMVCGADGGRFKADELVAHARDQHWETLAQSSSELSAELRRRTPAHRRLGLLARALITRLRKPLLLRRRRGVSIALMGPNGVGKSTAAAGLQGSLPFDSRILYMGIWKASSGGPGGTRRVWEIATRPLRLWSRYLVAQYHQSRGRLVVFDRYVYEALLPPRPPLTAAKRTYFWMLAHLVPAPSAVIVLDVAGHVAYRRKQENPPGELEFERRVYAGLTSRLASLELVDAGVDADGVRADITAIIWREMCARWRGSRRGAR
jgi:thymidylate kinase